MKATTDKFDSMRAFSEEVVKSPLLLFTESHEYLSTHLVRVVLYFWLLAYFPSLEGGGGDCHIWTQHTRMCQYAFIASLSLL